RIRPVCFDSVFHGFSLVLFYKAKDLEPELRWFANAFRVRPTIIAQANAECNPLKIKNAAGNGGVF
ncbi:MAG: hypothetical protein J5958_00845, partial [Clostridia bacterium]|nr:hypothetical protein [Clostridia bacterium]